MMKNKGPDYIKHKDEIEVERWKSMSDAEVLMLMGGTANGFFFCSLANTDWLTTFVSFMLVVGICYWLHVGYGYRLFPLQK